MPCPHTTRDDCSLCAVTLDGDSISGATLLRGSGEHTDPEFLSAGASIGRYIVLERLGQGGMGVLYTAHDPQLQRIVAIKVLRTAATARQSETSGQARLLREAQAMAQLAHPNVVQIYDSGPFGTGVFIVMELVRGRTLDLWVKLKPRPWREVLQLFVHAGRGLLAAHDAGLVHRDFKPTNVLVGDDGRPRVTDFGLARALRPMADDDDDGLFTEEVTRSGPVSLDEPLTQAGAMMGSPGYMAPEQYAGAETSPATDQFAFCVSLYEALYGERPFVGRSLPELEVVTARGQVPPAPKSSEVPAWVRAIVVRGLAPAPGDRHESMGVLLDALSHDPALRRRRWLAAGGAAALLALSVGGAAWSGSRQARACRGSEARLAGTWDPEVKRAGRGAFAATGLPFAQPSFQLLERSLDAWAAQWVEARTEACEATRVRGEQTERQLVLRLGCLDQKLEELGTLTRAFARADAALVMAAGSAVNQLSPVAACANVKQLEDRRQPPPELVPTAAQLGQQLAQGRALLAAGRFDDARQRLAGVRDQAVAVGLSGLECDAAELLGDLHLQLRQFPEAYAALRQSARAAEAAADDVAVARVLARLVSVAGWRLERTEEARTWAALTEGLLLRLGGNHDVEARLEEGIGDTEWQAGRRPESLAAYRRSLALFLTLQGPESLDVARLRSSVGWVLTEQGELDGAREEIDRSRAIRERLLGPGHPALAPTWNELSALATERRDFAEAVRSARQTYAANEQLGPNAARTLWAGVTLAVALARSGDGDAALAELSQYAAELAAHPDDFQSARAEYRRARVHALTALGREKEALAEARPLLAETELRAGAAAPETAELLATLVAPALALGQHADALAWADRSLAFRASLGGRDTPLSGMTLWHSAQALLALGRPAEAVPRAERAVVALRRGHPDPGTVAGARFTLAKALDAVPARQREADGVLAAALVDARAAGDEGLLRELEAWRGRRRPPR